MTVLHLQYYSIQAQKTHNIESTTNCYNTRCMMGEPGPHAVTATEFHGYRITNMKHKIIIDHSLTVFTHTHIQTMDPCVTTTIGVEQVINTQVYTIFTM